MIKTPKHHKRKNKKCEWKIALQNGKWYDKTIQKKIHKTKLKK